ncbi:MAG: GPR endopeptidase [Clostridiales bacterium]|jgi:GPR endopeptidase|nr:GPR endopeptidase [Clostridiales bacterium]
MEIRTDLALEAREMIDEKRSGRMKQKNVLPEGMTVNNRETEYIVITDIDITSEEAERTIGKKQGKYITIELKNPELNTIEVQESVSKVLAEEINKFIMTLNREEPEIMIAGLGNWHITADSLGPKVIDKIVVTRHVKNMKDVEIDGRLGSVCAVSPGVMGITGIETSEIIRGMLSTVQPDILFVIDALASRKASRVNTTIQISDTGIIPGSGVGNHRMELSKEVLGIPVIAIGVPTVVDAVTLVRDILEKAGVKESEHILKEAEAKVTEEMVVTPKNIDIAIERMAAVISNGMNLATHKGFEINEINEYLI